MFIAFYHYVHTQFSCTIQTLQSDGGGEYIGKSFQLFLSAKGIVHHKSCPYTPEQNGLAERKHRHLIETTITLLHQAKLPSNFWSYAIHTAVYLINRMPSPVLNNTSPYEILFKFVPLITHLRIFGCACFPLLRPYNSNKLQPKTVTCVFLGYASSYKGYICYDVLSNRTYVSRHVVFNESVFPYHNLASGSKSSSSSIGSPLLVPVVNNDNVAVLSQSTCCSSSPVSPTISPPGSIAPAPLHDLSHDVDPQSSSENTSVHNASSGGSFSPAVISEVLPLPSLNVHPMQTRSKSGIFKKKVYLVSIKDSSSTDLSLTEPSGYKSAMKHPSWRQAMQEEIDALHSQGTWTLVPLPSHKNLVGCKWIFKLKKNVDGSVARHKARLVAQGFSQEPGLDYGETFSPVVKPTTVRIVLALAAQFGWVLSQLDIKNAFLHGILQEEVFMAQPPGFVDVTYPDLVCKLHKSLYGLKQAPRAWNDRFTSFLPSLGFQHTYSDSSLFVKSLATGVVVLLVYVDDIIITGRDSCAVGDVITALTSEFDVKDLGCLHYILGVHVTATTTCTCLSQSQYIQELLLKTGMQDAKPCATPCLPYQRLLKDDGVLFDNPSLYRSIVGALHYLTFTRPDVAFSVHQVSQFMQQPLVAHFTAVKRILRYLKGTLHFGLNYTQGSLDLTAYSDADWADDPNDRRSMTGQLVFLGSNPVS